jgi:transcriptional regulator with XRE-family HTH domain
LGYSSQGAFAKSLDVNQVFISDIETGKKNPTLKIIENLFKEHNINLNYLIAGFGNMFNQTQNTVGEPIPQYGNTDKDLRQALEDCRKDKERAWAEVEWLRGQIDEIKKKEAS